MLKILLHNLHFYEMHGIHAEEALTGNEFEVNLEVAFQPAGVIVSRLEDTIDYTTLYDLVKRKMKIRSALLESIATSIATEIMETYDMVQQVNISIRKINAPITNFQGRVGVSYEIKR